MLRIDLGGVAANGLKLVQSGPDGDNILDLAKTVGVTGACEQGPELVALRALSVAEVGLTALVWRWLGGLFALSVTSPGVLSGVAADGALRLAKGTTFSGNVAIASVSLPAVELVWGERRIRFAVTAEQLTYHEEGGERRLDARALVLTGVHLSLPEGTLELGRLQGGAVCGKWASSGAFHLDCSRLEIKNGSMNWGGIRLGFDSLELPNGLSLSRSRVSFAELNLRGLRGEARKLGTLLASQKPKPSSPTSTVAASSVRWDLPFLDHLNGRVHADMQVEVSLPIIKKRATSYSPRLDLDHGIINYKHLERGLSWLEDALVDFELQGDRLILELDPIPLVTFDNRTLAWWPLAGEDLALARTQRVRLRKLLDYRLDTFLAAPKPQSSEAGKELLLKLDLDNIDVELALPECGEMDLFGHGRVRLGAHGKPTLSSLRLGGAVHYRAQTPQDSTELRGEARELFLQALELHLHGWGIELGVIDVRAVERLRLGLNGLTPQSFEVGIGMLGLRGGLLSFPSRSSYGRG